MTGGKRVAYKPTWGHTGPRHVSDCHPDRFEVRRYLQGGKGGWRARVFCTVCSKSVSGDLTTKEIEHDYQTQVMALPIMGSPYRNRPANTNPRPGGWRTYAEYINSTSWKWRRDEAVARAGGRCQICNGLEGVQVHHRTYERLGNEAPEDLTVLCRRCHGRFHDVMPEVTEP